MHRALREAKDSMHVSISYLGKLKGTMQNETTKLVVGWSVSPGCRLHQEWGSCIEYGR